MKTIRHELKASIDRAVKAEAKTRNETTGKYAASIAGRWSRKIQTSEIGGHELVYVGHRGVVLGAVAELQTVLASALTQSKDRPKKGVKK